MIPDIENLSYRRSYLKSIYGFLLLIFTIACSKEESNVKNSVKFEISEVHDEKGYVNQPLVTEISIAQEPTVESLTYHLSYRFISGEGYFLDKDGQKISEGDRMENIPLISSLQYVGTNVGNHNVSIEIESEIGAIKRLEVHYSLAHVPVQWKASALNSKVEEGNEIIIELLLQTDYLKPSSYQWGYQSTDEEGILTFGVSENDTIREIRVNAYYKITPGAYRLKFSPHKLGEQVLAFTLKDGNGLEVVEELKILIDKSSGITMIDIVEEVTELEINETYQLSWTYEPSDAIAPIWQWTSEDAKVATINEVGKVAALSAGSSWIKAVLKENDAVRDSVRVVVMEPVDTQKPIISLNGAESIVVNYGDIYQELGATTDDGSPVIINPTSIDTKVDETYTITYNASDGKNNAETVTRQVRINYFPTPLPNFQYSEFLDGGGAWVRFGETSFDREDDSFKMSYSWDFGDSASGGDNSSTSRIPNHLYRTPGTYVVTLTVTDTDGAVVSEQVEVKIPTDKPSYVFDYEQSGAVMDPSERYPPVPYSLTLNQTAQDLDIAFQLELVQVFIDDFSSGEQEEGFVGDYLMDLDRQANLIQIWGMEENIGFCQQIIFVAELRNNLGLEPKLVAITYSYSAVDGGTCF